MSIVVLMVKCPTWPVMTLAYTPCLIGEEIQDDIGAQLAALPGVLKAVGRLDLRVATLQNQVACLLGVVNQALPQRLEDMEHRMGRLAKRG